MCISPRIGIALWFLTFLLPNLLVKDLLKASGVHILQLFACINPPWERGHVESSCNCDNLYRSKQQVCIVFVKRRAKTESSAQLIYGIH